MYKKEIKVLIVINKVIYQLLIFWFVFKKYARIKRRSNFFFADDLGKID